jgi:riboflavin transporter FmnP
MAGGKKTKGGHIMENLGFVLACAATVAALFLAAALFEKYVVRDRKAFSSTHYLTYTAIFASLAGVLMFLEIPLFFAPSFYKIDLSEIPILICTFYLGPVAGVAAELVKIMVKLLLKGTSTAFVGDFANFVVGCSFVLPASIIYHARPGKRSALVGMVAGTLVMTVFGSAFNAIYLLPKFAALYGMPMEAIIGMGTKINPRITSVGTLVLFAVVPFNLLKGVIDSALTFLLYKRISPILHKGDQRRRQRRVQTAKENA